MINGAEGGVENGEAGEEQAVKDELTQMLKDPNTTEADVVTLLTKYGRNTERERLSGIITGELENIRHVDDKVRDEGRLTETIEFAVDQIMFWSDPENK